MAKIKIFVSDSEGHVKNLEVEGPQAQQFIGKKIGDDVTLLIQRNGGGLREILVTVTLTETPDELER